MGKTCYRLSSGNRGFTLVEVLAAATLLSIGLLAVMLTGGTAGDYQRRAELICLGRAIAQSRIDQLRSLPVDSLPAQTGATSDPSLPKGNSVVTTVSSYPNTDEKDLYRVVVSVSWPEGKGTRTIKYETLIVRR